MKTLPLPTYWTLTHAGDSGDAPARVRDRRVEAEVPGCVHTDLMRAGLIPDPYVGTNEHEQHWIGRTDWRYACAFETAGGIASEDRVELVFDGLDTIAEITLNGHAIGEASNMHHPHRFDVRGVLRSGRNELAVVFRSPHRWAREMEARLGSLPCAGGGANEHVPHNMIRKMACNFGWDWGPALTTSGLWRPARLEAWSTARIDAVRPLVVSADEAHAEIELHVDAKRDASDAALSVDFELRDPDGSVVAQGSGPLEGGPIRIAVEAPRLWWPAGWGEQPLYTLGVSLADDSGRCLDRASHRVGLRTIELERAPDGGTSRFGRGESFALCINGRRVFCKGANWIPDDCFPHRVTRERYRERVGQAVSANMNMLRVWGGGIYESDDFYDACDEMGVMVWQDFMCACACYAEEEPLLSSFEHEARHQVARLSGRASVVLWNGSNESVWASFAWGDAWEDARLDPTRGWGMGYFDGVFRRAVEDLDPTVPYWPSSPYSGSLEYFPNDDERGNQHIWDVWNGEGDYRGYYKHAPRFAAEFGFHGPPTWPTVEASIPGNERSWRSRSMEHHNKQPDGQRLALDRLETDFELPDDFDELLYLAQVNQARALSAGCAWFRALWPWCAGALFWQLNDCWPVASWSAIDGLGRPKPLWYAARSFFAPRLLTIAPYEADPDARACVYAHNDSDEPWRASVSTRLMTLEGEVLSEEQDRLDVPARACVRIDPDHVDGRPGQVLVGEAGEHRAVWFFGRDREISYPEPSFEAELSGEAGSQRLTVRAKSVIRDLCVFPDRLDPNASVSEQFVTLLPADEREFVIAGGGRHFGLEELTSAPVFRCVNPFGARVGV